MTRTVKTKNTASDAPPVHNRRGIVHHIDLVSRASRPGVSCRWAMLSRTRWLKISSFVSVRALSSRFKSSPSFSAHVLSASAAALSGSEASNSDSSRPLSWPSTHAVHFSSNVFINVSQQILQFLARIKQARHHRADGASKCFCNFVILHAFDLFHQNDSALLGRKLSDRLLDSAADLVSLHCLVRQRFRYRNGSGSWINFP